ncbi:MAG TPA: DUF503 domain-containing protein [Acidimicrobiales bacterium]|nr:DUF503 domain-containing protein [Acidimicrobiales bacterium]
MTAHVLTLTVDLQIGSARSLKDKRAVVTPILEGSRRRFLVAASETGRQDLHQRAELSFAAVSGAAAHSSEVIDTVERFVWSFPEVDVVAARRHWLEVDA